MNCCSCEPIVKLNPEGLKLVFILKILFYIFLVLTILQFFFIDFSGAINSIIALLVLFLLFNQANYMFAGLLMVFVTFSLFYASIFIGLRIQNRILGLKDVYTEEGRYIAVLVIYSLSFIFYIVLIFYSFKAYKEFKALLYCK